MISKKRSEVEEKYTWDLTHLCENDEVFKENLKEIEKEVDDFSEKYKGKLNTKEIVDEVIGPMEDLQSKFIRTFSYAYLGYNVDMSEPRTQELMSLASNTGQILNEKLSFVTNELIELDDSLLDEIAEMSERNRGIVHQIKRKKKNYLGKEIEEALSGISSIFEAPFSIYSSAKHADLSFEPFEVDGEEYPLSLVLFENYYEGLEDTKVRRKAFESFSKQLRKYQHTMAQTLAEQVRAEKSMSKLRGYDSVFDYLLDKQEISRELYDRQIDIIMEKFAPVVRKYAGLLKRTNNLDKMTYADLKISLDPEFNETISIEEAKEKLMSGLSILGDEYVDMVRRAFEERWIDFPINDGKTNGAFCMSPYGAHSHVLNSWTGSLEDLFVLGHELGHAGHSMYAQKNNSLSNSRSSLYFVEAPSTMNELVLANDMITWSEEPSFKRFVLSSMISRTYYHNMVTHLLEAHFQREVYKRIDEGKGVNATVLNDLFRKTLEEFWGDAVELTEGAELTWMRQLHYYKGLYPYTYSAGLTIGTMASKRIKNEGKAAVDDWIKTLSAGGSKDAVGLAKLAGVDITTDKPLLETIEYLSDIVDEIEKLTDELE